MLLAHSSNNPEATMASRSGRCDWPLKDLVQLLTEPRTLPAMAVLSRAMVCVRKHVQYSGRSLSQDAFACLLVLPPAK